MDDDVVEEAMSIDPRNVHAELVRQFETMARLVLRQGMDVDELHAILDRATEPFVHQVEHVPLVAPEGYSLVKKPELIGLGVPTR